MKLTALCLLFCFFVCQFAYSQIKIQTPVVKAPVLKSVSPSTAPLIALNQNTLTPANPTIEELAGFTYKGGEYDEKTKRLFLHGCANLSSLPCIPGPCACDAAMNINILDPIHTGYRIDVVVNYDKSYYKDALLVDYSKVPEYNNYYFAASGPDVVHSYLLGNTKREIVTNNQTNLLGVQRLTLLIKQKADGTRFTAADFKNIEIKLTADYTFEVRSVVVTPL